MNPRRHFFRTLIAAIPGLFLVTRCKDHSDKITAAIGGEEMTALAPVLEKNRKLPRKLLYQLLDQKSTEYMNLSYNCAQSSYLALSEQFEITSASVLKALTPLTGIAERGETCGAVTGCLMCIGQVFGRSRESLGDWQKYRDALIPAGEFCRNFEEVYQTTQCCEIQSGIYGKCFHLTKPEELREFQNSGATEKCTKVVQQAVRLAADELLDFHTQG